MPIETALVFDKETKQWGIRNDFLAFLPYWLTIDPPNQQITVPAGAQTPSYPMTYRNDGPFRGSYLFFTTDYDDLLIRMTDGRDGYAYTMRDRPVHLRTIASAQAGFPAILPEALVVQHQSAINVQFQNLDGINDATLRLTVQGFAFEPTRVTTQSTRDKIYSVLDRVHFIRSHFAPLDLGVATVPNGSRLPFYMTYDDSGYFETFKLNAIAYESGTVTELTATQRDNVFVQLYDANTRQFTQSGNPDIPLSVLAGTGAQPNIWPARIMVPPKAQLKVEIQNSSGVDIDVYLTFVGRRIAAPDVVYTPPPQGYAPAREIQRAKPPGA